MQKPPKQKGEKQGGKYTAPNGTPVGTTDGERVPFNSGEVSLYRFAPFGATFVGGSGKEFIFGKCSQSPE